MRASLKTLWLQRSARERRLLVLASLVLGVALLWQLGLAPALNTWRIAGQRQAELDLQTRQMLQLQAEARQLQTPVRVARQEAIVLLERSASSLLGPDAQLNVQGDVLRIRMSAAPAQGLAQWLAQAREQALARPQSARLERVSPARNNSRPAAPEAPPEANAWRGEITLRLP